MKLLTIMKMLTSYVFMLEVLNYCFLNCKPSQIEYFNKLK